MYTSTAPTTAITARPAFSAIQASTMSICDAKASPTPIAAPTHSAALASDATTNAPAGILSAPAIGGPTVEKPGTNFDTTTEKQPHRSKMPSVSRTHVSGDNETRHRNRSTGYP